MPKLIVPFDPALILTREHLRAIKRLPRNSPLRDWPVYWRGRAAHRDALMAQLDADDPERHAAVATLGAAPTFPHKWDAFLAHAGEDLTLLETHGVSPNVIAASIVLYAWDWRIPERLPARHGGLQAREEAWVARTPERLRLGAGELSGDAVTTAAGRVRPDDVPNTEDVRKLIAATEAGRDRTLFLTAVLTGALVGELLALQWGDVALDAGKLTIRRSVSWARVKDDEAAVRARFFGPKTAAGNRTLDMPPQLRRVLREWKVACPPSALDLVFPGDDGGVWHRTTMTRRSYYAALRRAGVRLFNFHALRHYFASTMLASGAKLPEVAHVLGHSSPQVTLKVYAHWLRDERTTAMQSVASAVCDSQPDARYRRSVSGHQVVTESSSEGQSVAVSS